MITGTLSQTNGYTKQPSVWVTDALHEAGVPYDELFNTYSGIVNRATGTNTGHQDNQLQVLMSFTHLLESWVNHTKNSDDSSKRRIFRLQCSQDQILTAQSVLDPLTGMKEQGAKDLVHRTKAKLTQAESSAKQVLWDM